VFFSFFFFFFEICVLFVLTNLGSLVYVGCPSFKSLKTKNMYKHSGRTLLECQTNMMPRTKTTIMGQNFHIYNVRTIHRQSRKKIAIHRHHHHVYASHASSNQKLKKLYSCTFVPIPVYAHLYSTKMHFAYFSTGGPAIMSICIYSNLPKRTIYLSGSCTSIQPESPVAANSI
jgi:hypothetical protein